MSLAPITENTHNVVLELAYATPDNFTGQPVYRQPLCFLHQDALTLLEYAIDLAAAQDLRFKIFDAFRPQKAQEALWAFCPNPDYVKPPEKGSPHTRGVAVDLTLIDQAGHELDMGTPFDSFEEASHHGAGGITQQATQNRQLLLDIMSKAGWDFYQNEWWHYQMFNASSYPLVLDDYGILSGA